MIVVRSELSLFRNYYLYPLSLIVGRPLSRERLTIDNGRIRHVDRDYR